MKGITTVLLVTGFLGSGKTTFLNQLIKSFPEDLKLTVLMNEFGDIGVDGTLIEGDDIEMMEISRGSIFCVCVKTDFIKGLCELDVRIQPDFLVIESTGVADPSDLKRDLSLPIFHNRFKLTDQFCIIDAAHFLDAYKTFAAVEKQLETSTVFIINKIDLVTEDIIEKIKEVVGEHHPQPRFVETSFSTLPLGLFSFSTKDNGQERGNEKLNSDSAFQALSPRELDSFIADLLDRSDPGIKPPDELASMTCRWQGENLEEIRGMAERLPPSIIRAKGFLQEGRDVYLFSFVMGNWSLEQWGRDRADIKHMNVVVLIGREGGMDGVTAALEGGRWSVGKVLQPMLQTSIT